MRLPKINKDNSLSGIVYQAIYKQILAGKLKPGEKITKHIVSASFATGSVITIDGGFDAFSGV